MEISPKKRALVVLAVLIGASAALAGVYVHGLRHELSRASATSIPDIVQELPSNASVVSYIDVASLRNLNDSPLTKIWDAGKGGPGGSDREYLDFVRDTGFDYTRDLDRVAVAFWPVGLGASRDVSKSGRYLAIANGRFDQKKIDAYARRSGKATERDGRTIYEIPGKSPVSVAFLSPTRIEFASERDLIGSASHSAQDSNAEALIGRVGASPFFAVVRTGGLPDAVYRNLAGSPQVQALVRGIQALTLAGQPEGQNIEVVLDGQCDAATNASAVASLLEVSRMGGALALANAKAKKQMPQAQADLLQSVLSQLKISHQDRWVRVSLEVTPAMLQSASTSPLANARP